MDEDDERAALGKVSIAISLGETRASGLCNRGRPRRREAEAKRCNPNGPGSVAFHGRGQLVATNATLDDLAWELQSAIVDRPVVNKTGLSARFNFTLTWTPDEFQNSNLAGPAPTNDVPGLFTAIQQQLGIRLEASRSIVDVMVVNSVELPSRD